MSEVTATRWLKSLVPVDLKDLEAVSRHTELQEWLESTPWPGSSAAVPSQSAAFPGRTRTTPLPTGTAARPFSDLHEDPAFEAAALQVMSATVREGQVVVAAGDLP